MKQPLAPTVCGTCRASITFCASRHRRSGGPCCAHCTHADFDTATTRTKIKEK